MIISEGQVALRLLALACPPGGISVMVAAYFQAVGRAPEAAQVYPAAQHVTQRQILLAGQP